MIEKGKLRPGMWVYKDFNKTRGHYYIYRIGKIVNELVHFDITLKLLQREGPWYGRWISGEREYDEEANTRYGGHSIFATEQYWTELKRWDKAKRRAVIASIMGDKFED